MSNESVLNAFDEEESGGGSGTITIPDFEVADSKRIAEGAYPGTLTKISDKPTSTGKPQISFVFELDLGDEKTMDIWLNNYLTPAAMFRFQRTAEVLGIQPNTELDVSEYIGKQVMVNVIDNDYGGTITSKADTIDAMPGAFDKGSDADDDIKF